MAQRKFIIDGGFKTDDASELLANLTMGGSILPNVDSDGTTGFDLGSTSFKWRDLYLSQGSLFINNQKVLEDDSGTIIVRSDTDQGLTIKTEGTGALTLSSQVPLAINATLQMASGKRITDAGGAAVTFGDKIDMDSNRIVNVSTPVDTTDVTNKAYVDQQVANVINGAPGALDTLNELANALGDDANFSATVTANIATNSTAITTANTNIATNAADISTNQAAIVSANASRVADVAALNTLVSAETTNRVSGDTAAIASAGNYTDNTVSNALTTAATDATTKADAAEADAIAAAGTYTDTRESAITTAYTAAIASGVSSSGTSANTYTDTEIATATTSLQSYADTAEADAIATAAADATAKANAAQSAAEATAATDATTKANAAQSAAEATAASDATAKVDAATTSITTAYQSYADTAEADAVSTAATAAQAKVDTLESSLTHFHSAVTDITDDSDNTYTFSELTNARHYVVYLNRLVLRANEYSVSGTTVTLVSGTHAVGDELEVTGFSS